MALRQFAKSVLTGRTTAETATLTGVVAGNTVGITIAYWELNSALMATPTATSHTFTALHADLTDSATDAHNRSWYAENSPGGSVTVTFDVTGTGAADITVIIWEIDNLPATTGNLTGTPATVVTNGLGATGTTGTVTPGAYPALALSTVAWAGNDTTSTPEGTWTHVDENEGGSANMPIGMAQKDVASGTFTGQFTLGANREIMVAAFAFKQNAGGGGGGVTNRDKPTVPIVWGTITNGTTGAAATVTPPAGANNLNDLGLIFIACDSTTAPTTPTNWTLIDGGANTSELYIYGKLFTAGESWPATVAAPAQDYVLVPGRIRASDHSVTSVATDIVKSTAATNTSTAANATAATAATARNYLAITATSVDLTATGGAISAVPSTYTQVSITKSASSTSSVALGVATKQLTNVTSEDAGAFTNTSNAWRAVTILIPPGYQKAIPFLHRRIRPPLLRR